MQENKRGNAGLSQYIEFADGNFVVSQETMYIKTLVFVEDLPTDEY